MILLRPVELGTLPVAHRLRLGRSRWRYQTTLLDTEPAVLVASDYPLANRPSDAKAAVSRGIRTDYLVIQHKNQQSTGSKLVPVAYRNTGQMLWRVSADRWAEHSGFSWCHFLKHCCFHMRPERGVEIGSQWYRGKALKYDGNRKNLLGMLISHARASQTGIANHGFGTYKHC